MKNTYQQESTRSCGCCGRTSVAVVRRHPSRRLLLARHLWTGRGFCPDSFLEIEPPAASAR